MSATLAHVMSRNETSPVRLRRTHQQMDDFRAAILAVADDYDRMSVRQLFYQLVARGVIAKTEREYKRVCEVSAKMRVDGELDYRKVTDGHRTRRFSLSHSGITNALEMAHDMYRRNYWIDQEKHVEIWCEKDALTGVIQAVCDRYGDTYVATRGFPSITLRYESAAALGVIGKPAVIYYFGDHDPSGQQISASLQEQLRRHYPDVCVYRMAINPSDIERYRLPLRPSKRSDSRYERFTVAHGEGSVELDALSPNVLEELVRDCIRSEIDTERWNAMQEIERLERETLASIAGISWRAGVTYSRSMLLGEDDGWVTE